MHTSLDCYPCGLRQALEASRHANLEPAQQREVLLETMAVLRDLNEQATPPEIAQRVHRAVRRLTLRDTYADAKRAQNEAALALLPRLRDQLSKAANPFELAVRYAAIGNTIDLGVAQNNCDVETELEGAERIPFARWDAPALESAVIKARRIVFLADNAGEIVFDRLLVEQLQRVSSAEVVVVVRGTPVLNDATIDDAHQVGLSQIARVVSNQSDAPATLLSEVGEEARALIDRADLILAKGQGNYESLSQATLPIAFILKAKCSVIAADLGVALGSFVVTARLT